MLTAKESPTRSAEISAGNVTVSFESEASIERAWEALTNPEMVGHWFGTLSLEIAPGNSPRLDFGDGDYFELDNIRLESVRRIEYDWRFLGTGPVNHISWIIEPAQDGCRITVRDEAHERSPEGAEELKAGWTDFTLRLEKHLESGLFTRYQWRRDFDGSIELPCDVRAAWDVLFDTERTDRWLPIDSATLLEGETFRLDDGGEPARFRISRISKEAPDQLSFRLSRDDWDAPTNCWIGLASRVRGTLLTVRHLGWEGIVPDEDGQKQLRRRFGECWIASLQKARMLVG